MKTLPVSFQLLELIAEALRLSAEPDEHLDPHIVTGFAMLGRSSDPGGMRTPGTGPQPELGEVVFIV
ncbi:hypothetical protein [Streptomyces sp. NBC_00859]|uniref:hypothetical protein n=1 Tax=Streptomyces sp. NBC_00859 TaxID=2903682 RepID=UPI003863D9D4|nr:hypothetical protein OG584_18200 [Streptomyces sp. NBC_00859]